VAPVHSKLTVWKVGSNDISQYCNSSNLKRTADSHDVTTYGKNSHVYRGGLLDGTASLGGFYDSTAVTGPRAVLEPLIGTTVEITHWPEGAGSGKPSDVFDALVTDYTEDKPIADFVTWSLELQLSDDVDSTAQGS
jgi:hypothetical protein